MKYYILERALGETPTGRKLLYSSGDNFLLASYSAAFGQPEVLVFKSDKDGNISDWAECYGEKHDKQTSINEAIHSTMVRFNKIGPQE